MFKFVEEKKGGDLATFDCVIGMQGRRFVSLWLRTGDHFKAIYRFERSKGVTGWRCYKLV